jgi:stage II sporulation protein AA (anti-sigma F factor antagonist)
MTKIQKERLTIEFIDEITIVRLLDREIHQVFCGPDDVEAIGKQIESLIRSARPKHLLLDLSDVEFMASFMQASLLTLQKKLRRAGGRLKLCGMRGQVELSFRITGLSQMFAIHPDERSALDAFDAGR